MRELLHGQICPTKLKLVPTQFLMNTKDVVNYDYCHYMFSTCLFVPMKATNDSYTIHFIHISCIKYTFYTESPTEGVGWYYKAEYPRTSCLGTKTWGMRHVSGKS